MANTRYPHFAAYRDELVISTKADYYMWPGLYGERGSRKYLLNSLDARRLRLEYVDTVSSHRPDPEAPLAETMGALATAVMSGKARHVGVSNYGAEQTGEAHRIMNELGVPLVIHQPRYSAFDRDMEEALPGILAELDPHAVHGTGTR